MRRSVLMAFGLAAVFFSTAPAEATCMETFDKFGVRMYSCSPPGGPPQSYVCYGDTCYPV